MGRVAAWRSRWNRARFLALLGLSLVALAARAEGTEAGVVEFESESTGSRRLGLPRLSLLGCELPGVAFTLGSLDPCASWMAWEVLGSAQPRPAAAAWLAPSLWPRARGLSLVGGRSTRVTAFADESTRTGRNPIDSLAAYVFWLRPALLLSADGAVVGYELSARGEAVSFAPWVSAQTQGLRFRTAF